MKKIMMTLAAVLCCAMTVTVGLTSCSQSDNPVDPKPEKRVAMADVVTLDAAPQAFYKLNTQDVLPICIAVNSAYKDEKGETKFYDLSTITDVRESTDMFIVDASHLADNGYIKLTLGAEDTQKLIELFEDYHAYSWGTDITVLLTNIYGEELSSELHLEYLPKIEQKEVLTVKKSDLNENNELILNPAVIAQFNLSEWPNNRFGDNTFCDYGDFRNAKLTEDGKLLVQTYGDTTEPDDPYKLTLIFERKLTGSPLPELPEGEGLMVNFRYELELNITE
jgi:hypothetical protein